MHRKKLKALVLKLINKVKERGGTLNPAQEANFCVHLGFVLLFFLTLDENRPR